jgi:hypothetical protein
MSRLSRPLLVALAPAATAVLALGALAAGAAAPAAPPANTAKPAISGTARDGETLTASPGTWSGAPTSYSYQWIRCSATVSNCNPINGATGRTYNLTASDVGRRLIVSVTARNADGANSAQSNATAVVAARATRPTNTGKPTISGTAREGERLTASNGSWSGTQPLSYSYQWIRCSPTVSNCSSISGATNTVYSLTASDVGRRLIVSVTARNSAGARSAQSDASAVVAPRGTAPAATSPPAITGTPRVGQTLTVSSGSWSGTQPLAFSYQWQRCDRNGGSCANIVGATAQTYRLTDVDVNHTIRAVVGASNQAGSTAATSVPTAVVAPATPPGPAGQIRLPSGKVSIPITSVSLPARLVIDGVSFAPNPVRSRRAAITGRFRVSDTRGFVVRGALVFVRSTPLVTTTPPEQASGQDGFVSFRFFPRANFPLRNGVNVQFFVRARKPGDNVLAGVSTRRLVQVRTARPR